MKTLSQQFELIKFEINFNTYHLKNVTKNSPFSIKRRKVFESFCLLTHPLKLHFEKELNSCIYSCTQKFWTKNGFEVRMRKISISFNIYFG